MFFFFNDTATTEIYTLSLHDALPIYTSLILTMTKNDNRYVALIADAVASRTLAPRARARLQSDVRSEEHTSELQSRLHLVCRLLLEKKKIDNTSILDNTCSPVVKPVR